MREPSRPIHLGSNPKFPQIPIPKPPTLDRDRSHQVKAALITTCTRAASSDAAAHPATALPPPRRCVQPFTPPPTPFRSPPLPPSPSFACGDVVWASAALSQVCLTFVFPSCCAKPGTPNPNIDFYSFCEFYWVYVHVYTHAPYYYVTPHASRPRSGCG